MARQTCCKCYGCRDHIYDNLYVRTDTEKEQAEQPVIAEII